jgi:hypothetical protein
MIDEEKTKLYSLVDGIEKVITIIRSIDSSTTVYYDNNKPVKEQLNNILKGFNEATFVVVYDDSTEEQQCNGFADRRFDTQGLLEYEKKIKCIPLAYSVGAFSVICALAHGLLLYSGKHWEGKWNYYQMILVSKINYFRWFEYTLSSAVMVVNIAALTRTTNILQLSNIAVLTGLTNLFGLWVEQTNPFSMRTVKGTRVIAFVAGCACFTMPWVVIFKRFFQSANYFRDEVKPAFFAPDEEEDTGRPGFLSDIDKWIKIVAKGLLAIYCFFPINMILQYWVFPKVLKNGDTNAYYFGELGYIILSFVSKAFLSLIVFGQSFQKGNEDRPATFCAD